MKYVLLEVLSERPMHGYEIISEIEKRSGGYRASPGSIYPTLQMLEEGGYLASDQVEGKKVYTVTSEGRKMLEESGASPFEANPRMKQASEMRRSVMKLGAAAMEAVRDGDEETIKRIAEVIGKARKEVYAILGGS
jgi:DNA-binding PadR family transcriptional regulator